MMKKLILIGSACLLITSSACVSNKKYALAEDTITSMRRQNRELKDDISNLRERLSLMEAANESAANQITEKENQLGKTQQQIEEQQERLRQLQNLIDRQKAQTEKLREKMANALGNFTSDQLSVFTKNGKVYVSLSEKLLFPSGSDVVNKEGKEALAMVANALNENVDINVNIEGHTDSIPISKRFEDNWALSVARSTAIVRLLTHDYKLNSNRVTASGRGEFEPIADNGTPDGRAKNRRTEIILAPKLDQLMQLIEGAE